MDSSYKEPPSGWLYLNTKLTVKSEQNPYLKIMPFTEFCNLIFREGRADQNDYIHGVTL